MQWLLALETEDDPIPACRLLNIFRRKSVKIGVLTLASRPGGYSMLALVETAEAEVEHIFNFLRRTEGVRHVTCYRHQPSPTASFVLKNLAAKTVAIIGYGSQGHAHALNLRDSGVKVIVGLPASSASRVKVQAEKLEVVEPAEAARRGDLIAILIPDPVQKQVYEKDIAPQLGPGKTLLFAHGFNIHFKFVV